MRREDRAYTGLHGPTEQVGGFVIEGVRHVCNPRGRNRAWSSMCGDHQTAVGIQMINVEDVDCPGCAAELFALLLATGRISG